MNDPMASLGADVVGNLRLDEIRERSGGGDAGGRAGRGRVRGEGAQRRERGHARSHAPILLDSSLALRMTDE
jgi:hypothetical protein